MNQSTSLLNTENPLQGIIDFCRDDVFQDIEINEDIDLQMIICEKLIQQQLQLSETKNKIQILEQQLKDQKYDDISKDKTQYVDNIMSLKNEISVTKTQIDQIKSQVNKNMSILFDGLEQQIDQVVKNFQVLNSQKHNDATKVSELQKVIQNLQSQLAQSQQSPVSGQSIEMETLNQITKEIVKYTDRLNSDLINYVLNIKKIKIKQVEDNVQKLQNILSNRCNKEQSQHVIENAKTASRQSKQLQQIKSICQQFEKDFAAIVGKQTDIKQRFQSIKQSINKVHNLAQQKNNKKSPIQSKKPIQPLYKNIVDKIQLDFNSDFIKTKTKWNQLYMRLKASSSKTLAIEQKFQLVRQKYQNLKTRNLKQAQLNFQKYQLQNQLYIKEKHQEHQLKKEKEKFYNEKIEFYEQQRKKNIKYKKKLKDKMISEQKQNSKQNTSSSPAAKQQTKVDDLQQIEQEVGNILLNSLKSSGEQQASLHNNSSQILSLEQPKNTLSDQQKRLELYGLLIEIFKDNFLIHGDHRQLKQNQAHVAQFIEQLKGCEQDMTIQNLKRQCQEQLNY